MLVRHVIGVTRIATSGVIPITVRPRETGPELFWLRRVIIEPIR